MAGKLIVIEGIDGVGKTTQAKRLTRKISKSLYIHDISSNETGTFGTCLNEILKFEPLSPLTEQLLIAASRCRNIEKVLKPLRNGQTVIADRFVWSSLVYSNRSLDHEPEMVKIVWQLHNLIRQKLEPDITIVLDLSPKEILDRLKNREEPLDRYENVKLNKLQYRRRLYNSLAMSHSNVFLVSAQGDEDEVHERIIDLLSEQDLI